MALLDTSVGYGFPMDSHKPTRWENGLPVYDRSYNASDLRGFFSLLVTNGVYIDYLDELLVYEKAGSWYVKPGAAVADGLLMPVDEEVKICDQSDIATGRYVYACIASRLDTDNLDFHVYARASSLSTTEPVRNDSGCELVLARIDWRGTMTDLRMDGSMCGPVQLLSQPDTESFTAALATAVDQFNLNVGTVATLPSGSTPTVTVRKPVMAGGDVYVDFGIPRGAPGEPGQSAPGVYVQEERPEEPGEGAVWMGTNPDTRQIEQIEVYELTGTYPDEFYPDEAYPDGTIKWTAYTIDPALITGAQQS